MYSTQVEYHVSHGDVISYHLQTFVHQHFQNICEKSASNTSQSLQHGRLKFKYLLLNLIQVQKMKIPSISVNWWMLSCIFHVLPILCCVVWFAQAYNRSIS